MEESTDFGFITLEDGSIFGISLYKDTYDNSEYKYVYLDEPVSTFKELLQIPEVADYLTSGYGYSYGIQDGDDKNNTSGEGGFIFVNDTKTIQKYITRSGTIRVVEHLPGDVDENKVLDINDAIKIAWACVNKDKVEKKYADVNLDGIVDAKDVIMILQSLRGKYGQSLKASEYKILLNLSGFDNDKILNDIEKEITISFYDENDNINNWSSSINFEEYIKKMERNGYKFVGWSNSLVGKTINPNDNIEYFNNQKQQMLYAIWEKNSIIFEIEDATSIPFENIDYSFTNSNVDLTEYMPKLSYSINYALSENNGIHISIGSYNLYKEFMGWYTDDSFTGEAITTYDLSIPNLGKISLYPKWSDYIWEKPVETREGYENVDNWYLSPDYKIDTKFIEVNSDTINMLKENGFNCYASAKYTQYKISFVLNLDGVVNNNEENLQYTIIKKPIIFSLADTKGYKFDGWYLNEDFSGAKIDSIPSNYTGDLILYAKWISQTNNITVKFVGVDNVGVESTIYYKYDDIHTSVDESGLYKDGVNRISLETFYDMIIDKHYYYYGLYENNLTNNGHSYLQTDGNNLVIDLDGKLINEDYVKNEDVCLYMAVKPIEYTFTLDQNEYNLIENKKENTSYPGSGCTIKYKSKNDYTVTMLTSNGKKSCTLGQYVYLNKDTKYTISLEFLSKYVSEISVILTNGSETKILRMNGRNNKTFSVSTSDTYNINISFEASGTIALMPTFPINNFSIYVDHTTSFNVCYKEDYEIILPSQVYYSGIYKYDNKIAIDKDGKLIWLNYDKMEDGKLIKNITLNSDFSIMRFGTEKDVKYISESSDFIDSMNASSNDTYTKYIIINDLDLSNCLINNSIEIFSELLDGRGHSIRNIKIEYLSDKDSYGESKTEYGLFRKLTNGGIIKNIDFINTNINVVKYKDGQKDLCVGGVVGYLDNGTLLNINMIDAIIEVEHFREVRSEDERVSSYVGGVVGKMSNGTITNCQISGISEIGGQALGAGEKSVAECFVGGIVGYQNGGSTIKSNCESEVKIYSLIIALGFSDTIRRAASGGVIGLIDNGVDKNLSSSASIDNITSSIVFNYDSADDKNYAQSNTIIGRDNRNA